MPKEKRDLLESPAEYGTNEASAVEVKFGGTAASLFEHLRLANSGKIPVHDMCFEFLHSAFGPSLLMFCKLL